MSSRETVEKYIADGAFPGAAWAFGDAESYQVGFAGRFTYEPESALVKASTVWDLASMTKVLATTTVAMRLVADGSLGLDDLVSAHLPESKLQSATVRNLLQHDSGLAPYDFNLASEVASRDEALDRILRNSPLHPPGVETAYSCLGFVTLQAIIERVAGTTLDVLFQRLVAEPLGMDSARYCPAEPELCPPTAYTEPWRKTGLPIVQGIVHDPVAWWLGGVSGNAGLFGTVVDIVRFAQAMLSSDPTFGGQVSEWTKLTGSGTRALGWDTKSVEGSSAGRWFGPRSYGHTGFTGTCLWIDPDQAFFATLLTNRVWPDPENLRIAQARPAFFEAAWTDWGLPT